jgi:flagellum-specific peptidoglycan hydrolase FlgJ
MEPAVQAAVAQEQAMVSALFDEGRAQEADSDAETKLRAAIERAERLSLARTRIRIHLDETEAQALSRDLFEKSKSTKLRTEAAQLLVDDWSQDWPADYRGEFLASVAPAALVSARTHHLPVSVTLAQAVLESGWGRSKLATEHGNLFGIKADPGQGGVKLRTTEGVNRRTTASFRTYDDWTDSIADHDRLLSQSPLYRQAQKKWTHWPAFVKAMAPRYATDPHYAYRLAQIIERYDLDNYDGLVIHSVGRDEAVAMRKALENTDA